ncbi:hypothetical protein [Methylobacterium sp. CM6247]
MPNYIPNRLVLSGPVDEIRRFHITCIRQQADADSVEVSLDFDAIIPMPAEILATMGNYTDAARAHALKATGFDDWYSWAVARWGTKWNASSFAILNAGPELIDVAFDTAWNGPEPIFRALAAQYPLLKGFSLGADPMMDWANLGVFDHGTYASTCSDAAELSFLTNDCMFGLEPSRLSAHALVQEWTAITSGGSPDGPTLSMAAAATAAVKAAFSAEAVVKLEFAVTHQAYAESFSECDAGELDQEAAADLAFFTAQDRSRTGLDLRLLEELAGTMSVEAVSVSCRDAGRVNFSARAKRLAERCGDGELHAWAALAMYRPGVSLDMSDSESIRAGLITYAGRLYEEAVAYLNGRAPVLMLQAPDAAVQGA